MQESNLLDPKVGALAKRYIAVLPIFQNWWRRLELNQLRVPFQGTALPMSYHAINLLANVSLHGWPDAVAVL